MSPAEEEWRDVMTGEGYFIGCSGCLLIVLAWLALDALALLAVGLLLKLVGGIIAC